MAYDKRFDGLSCLGIEVLAEVIREGEARLEAQLTAACASDQRAMAWAGFLVTMAIASTGGALALWIDGRHFPLAVIAGLFSATLVWAAIFAMDAARPTEFSFIGNRPLNWCPDE